VAIEFQGQEWTYAELRRAARAGRPNCAGAEIGIDDRVAICMTPCVEMVVAVLAVVVIGATYVPLNPSNPDQRLAFMLRDTESLAVITKRRSRRDLLALSPKCSASMNQSSKMDSTPSRYRLRRITQLTSCIRPARRVSQRESPSPTAR